MFQYSLRSIRSEINPDALYRIFRLLSLFRSPLLHGIPSDLPVTYLQTYIIKMRALSLQRSDHDTGYKIPLYKRIDTENRQRRDDRRTIAYQRFIDIGAACRVSSVENLCNIILDQDLAQYQLQREELSGFQIDHRVEPAVPLRYGHKQYQYGDRSLIQRNNDPEKNREISRTVKFC